MKFDLDTRARIFRQTYSAQGAYYWKFRNSLPGFTEISLRAEDVARETREGVVRLNAGIVEVDPVLSSLEKQMHGPLIDATEA